MQFAKMDKHELDETWQVRCLREIKEGRLTGIFSRVIIVLLFFTYLDDAQYFFHRVFSKRYVLKFPHLTGGATVLNNGWVVCDMNVGRLGERMKVHRNVKVFDTEGELIREFRNLADKLKLDDADRVAMTETVKKWVVADHRINHMGHRTVA